MWAGIPTTLKKVSLGFLHSLQANTRTVLRSSQDLILLNSSELISRQTHYHSILHSLTVAKYLQKGAHYLAGRRVVEDME
jgi:hypothetical protein